MRYKFLTKHFTRPRRMAIKHVTVHHMTIIGNGKGSANDACYRVWQSRPASAHYGVDGSDRCQFVRDGDSAWASGSVTGNHSGLHIEHANSTAGPSWKVTEATWKNGARLAAELHIKHKLGRPTSNSRGSSGTLRQHRSWFATACPGPFLTGIWNEYVREAQREYDRLTKPTPPPAPVRPPLTVTAMSFNIADKLGDDQKRIDAIVRNIRAGAPLVIGAQEGGSGFAEKLLAALEPSAWAMVKPTTALNENYLIYRKDRLTLVRQPADTIIRVNVGDRPIPGRHVTHAIFKHKANTGWFTAHVSHLVNDDPAGAQAQAQKVIESIREHKGDRPSVLMVDRNVAGPLTALTTMQDARLKAKRSYRAYLGTFRKWTASKPVDFNEAPCIDAIYWTSSWDVATYAVQGVAPDGIADEPRASDHLAVTSTATAPTK